MPGLRRIMLVRRPYRQPLNRAIRSRNTQHHRRILRIVRNPAIRRQRPPRTLSSPHVRLPNTRLRSIPLLNTQRQLRSNTLHHPSMRLRPSILRRSMQRPSLHRSTNPRLRSRRKRKKSSRSAKASFSTVLVAPSLRSAQRTARMGKLQNSTQRTSVHRQHADRDQIPHPARGALFARRHQLERAVGHDGFAIFAIGHQHCRVMHVRADLTERVHHFIAI